MYYSTG